MRTVTVQEAFTLRPTTGRGAVGISSRFDWEALIKLADSGPVVLEQGEDGDYQIKDETMLKYLRQQLAEMGATSRYTTFCNRSKHVVVIQARQSEETSEDDGDTDDNN